MKVLIIKTSSMGDVLHTLPAITDAAQHFPNITFDWVVEENFSAIPAWHPAVGKVIPIAIRRWRKNFWAAIKQGELINFLKQLRAEQYDYVIDAQGLFKSAIVTRLSRGNRYGLNKQSAREPLASYFYQYKIAVKKGIHAVTRVRQLFAAVLDYELPNTIADYGVDAARLPALPSNLPARYLVFLHGTTWHTKHYPEQYWETLVRYADEAKLPVLLLWGNENEKKRAEKLARCSPLARVLPKLDLSDVASLLQKAKGIISVDTGLGHLAAAVAAPTISLYGPTNPVLTGTMGKNQYHLAAQFVCAPCLQRTCTYQSAGAAKPACFTTIPPAKVWQEAARVFSD